MNVKEEEFHMAVLEIWYSAVYFVLTSVHFRLDIAKPFKKNKYIKQKSNNVSKD